MRNRAVLARKPVIILAAFLFSMIPLSAQRTRLGISAGFSLAFFRGPDDLIYKKNEQRAYRAGVSISYDLGGGFSIQSGLEYWNRSFDGSLRSFGMLTVITPVRLKVQHLTVPLMLRYQAGRSLFFGAGAYLSHKIGGRLTLFQVESGRLERREFGYIAGVGTVFRLFRIDNVFEIQWRQGLTPVFAINDDKFYFSTLSLLYGLGF